MPGGSIGFTSADRPSARAVIGELGFQEVALREPAQVAGRLLTANSNAEDQTEISVQQPPEAATQATKGKYISSMLLRVVGN